MFETCLNNSFLPVLRFLPPIKLSTNDVIEILLKVVLTTITLTLNLMIFPNLYLQTGEAFWRNFVQFSIITLIRYTTIIFKTCSIGSEVPLLQGHSHQRPSLLSGLISGALSYKHTTKQSPSREAILLYKATFSLLKWCLYKRVTTVSLFFIEIKNKLYFQWNFQEGS